MGSGASKTPTLYIFPLSAPCRAVMMASAAAKIPLELKTIDLLKGEQKEESFLLVCIFFSEFDSISSVA